MSKNMKMRLTNGLFWTSVGVAALIILATALAGTGCANRTYTIRAYDGQTGKLTKEFRATTRTLLESTEADIKMPVDTNGFPTSLNVTAKTDPSAAAMQAAGDVAAKVVGAAVSAAKPAP